MSEDENVENNKPNGASKGTSRRDFLKVTFAMGAVGAIVGVAGLFTQYLTFIPGTNINYVWPKVKVGSLSDLKPLAPVLFNYPLTNEPNLLVKLGVKAANGIGPDADIVAFSQVCQHLGCIYGFQSKGSSPSCNKSYVMPVTGGYCCCHGSHYSFVDEGAVIGGPAPRPVPQVTLELDESTGDIYAVAMGPPSIYGHSTGDETPQAVLEDDLTGGSLVTGAVTTFSTTSPAGGTNSTSTIDGPSS